MIIKGKVNYVEKKNRSNGEFNSASVSIDITEGVYNYLSGKFSTPVDITGKEVYIMTGEAFDSIKFDQNNDCSTTCALRDALCGFDKRISDLKKEIESLRDIMNGTVKRISGLEEEVKVLTANKWTVSANIYSSYTNDYIHHWEGGVFDTYEDAYSFWNKWYPPKNEVSGVVDDWNEKNPGDELDIEIGLWGPDEEKHEFFVESV